MTSSQSKASHQSITHIEAFRQINSKPTRIQSIRNGIRSSQMFFLTQQLHIFRWPVVDFICCFCSSLITCRQCPLPNCPFTSHSSSSNYLLFFEIAHSSSGVECRIKLDDRVVWTIYCKICTCSDFWKIWGIFGWVCYEGGGRKLLICPGNTGTECWCCWWLLSCLIWWPWSIKKGMTTTEKLMVYPHTISHTILSRNG